LRVISLVILPCASMIPSRIRLDARRDDCIMLPREVFGRRLFEHFQVCNQIVALLLVCNPGERHGVAWNRLLRRHNECVERFFVPDNVRIFHGLAIAEPWLRPGMPPYDSKQAGSNAIGFVLRMAEYTLGIFMLALGGITRTVAGHDSEPDRNSSYG